MTENNVTPDPETDDAVQPVDPDLSADDSTLILPKAADDGSTLIARQPADDDSTLILPKVPDQEMPVDAEADDETLVDAPAASYDDETQVDAPAAAVEEIPAAVSVPAEDWNLGDIDAALAAVASLSEMMPEREAEALARADARQGKPSFVPEMKMPPLMTLKRGQIGSVVPALLLIGLGAWLTLTTTSGTPPNPFLVAVVIVGGIVLSLLAQWLGTGRWSRGALFFGLLVLLIAGVVAFSIQPNGLDLLRGWPLMVVALGLAVALAGLLARPLNARLLVPGALIMVAGAVGLTVSLGLIPSNLQSIAIPLGPIMLVIVLILWMLPLVFRRRRS